MLKRVTFTGADDNTPVREILHLSEHHSFVEWGILFPAKGKGRFPSVEWIAELVGLAALSPFEVKLAAHLCEPWVQMVLDGSATIRDLIGTAFGRVQLNTHGVNFPVSALAISQILSDHREVILQLDRVTGEKIQQKLADLNGADQREIILQVAGLHDLSHGAGVVPHEWLKPVHRLKWTGYAGGLGPHNLREQLPLIAAAAGDGPYWIDMETHVRSDGRFDLGKVRECIAIAKPFITKEA